MRALRIFVSSVLFVCLALGAAAAADAKTPEDAIAAYVAGVAARDFDGILATTALDEMSANFDFVTYVDRIQALTPFAPAPSSDPLFIAINKADLTAGIARQVKFLAYGLLTKSDILKSQTTTMDEAGAQQFVTDVNLTPLSDIKLDKVGVPNPTRMKTDLYKKNAALFAKVYGANEFTERVALISFAGNDYLLGFSLLRYGVIWKISSQSSPMAGTDTLGVPAPTTPDAFDALTTK
jgi:hypothetical protein